MSTISYRFSADNPRLKTAIGIREINAIRIPMTDGTALYGPYVDLLAGLYEAVIHFDPDTPCSGAAMMDVCSGVGAERLAERWITANEILSGGMSVKLDFWCPRLSQDVEVRLVVDGEFSAGIRSVEINGKLAGSTTVLQRLSNLDLPAALSLFKPAAETQNKPIDLDDVTLVAVDTVAHDLTRLAVEECLRKANFGAVIIFSNRRIEISGSEYIPCDITNTNEAFLFRWQRMPEYIRTSHYLTVEWDSWVLDPQMWQATFLDFDYIGAPWNFDDGYNVGNGGFSLRSTRLARFVSSHPQRYPPLAPQDASSWWAEDAVLCRTYRAALEREGFRWPDEETASDFAFEHTLLAGHHRHFGFHGMCNWPIVLSLPEIGERMKCFNDYIMRHPHIRTMLTGLGVRYGADAPVLRWNVLHRSK
jgi:hypothetical protein